jgi:hypothetical protein
VILYLRFSDCNFKRLVSTPLHANCPDHFIIVGCITLMIYVEVVNVFHTCSKESSRVSILIAKKEIGMNSLLLTESQSRTYASSRSLLVQTA